ncbi:MULTISPECIES: FtsB family cell division protein [Enterococcus]|uniref:FtsB family cell division protein n=1 Tax=Enterococcus TaxID=1350 RepID=UPI00065E5BE8|nr:MULTISPECIES: septum formation initiator family protein [Enterococcus]KAF1304474.1 septum formation initiator [Enterococcus sp. JM9B]
MKNENNITTLDTAYAKAQYAKYKEQHQQVVFRRRRLGAIFIAAIAVFVFVGFQLFQDHQRLQELREIKQEAVLEQEEAAKTVAQLQHDVSLLKDDDYVAKLARSRFFYSKDGESVYPLPEGDNQTSESQSSTTTNE